MEKWIEQEEIYKAKIFSLWGGQVELDNGEIAVREYIRHSGGVGIVPVIDGNVILIRQFRISIERELNLLSQHNEHMLKLYLLQI